MVFLTIKVSFKYLTQSFGQILWSGTFSSLHDDPDIESIHRLTFDLFLNIPVKSELHV